MEEVTIVECPRDAWQALPQLIPAEQKAAYLQQLIDAGFRHIDAASFVSPKAVPQMADSEQVLARLERTSDVDIIAIVVNAKGAERAVRVSAVKTLGFPFSISAGFLERNQRQSPAEALTTVQAIAGFAHASGRGTVVYISMAFGNPYGEPWSARDVVAACRTLESVGVRQVSLADTVGLATAEQLSEVFGELWDAGLDMQVGLHLHARPDGAAAKIRAAYEAGCRRFDGALGGFGGCPFAQDALVGNIATETMLQTLGDLRARLPEIRNLDALREASETVCRMGGYKGA